MKAKKTLMVLLLFAIFILTGVLWPKSELGPQEEKDQALTEVVKGINIFCLDIFAAVRSEPGNQFYSPLSLATALAMVLEGAGGKTAEQMKEALHSPLNDELRREGMARLRELINLPRRKSRLHLANAIWVQKDIPILKTYLKTIAAFYDGRATNVDFINQGEVARRMINDWTAEKTAGKIKDLIPPGILNPLTQLVLTNAIYFRGLWLLPFDPKATRPEK